MRSPISPDRWDEIRATFEEIVELPAREREQRLKKIAAADPALRATLDALLHADATADDVLAPHESPLGYVPASEDIPPYDDAPSLTTAPREKMRRVLVAVLALLVVGTGAAVYLTQSAPPWVSANATAPALATPQDVAARKYNLVAVNLDGEERDVMGTRAVLAGRGGMAPLDTGYFAWPKISPDGKRIAVEVETGNQSWDIWIIDLEKGASRLTRDFTGVRPFEWTLDSRSLIYLSVDRADISGPHRVVQQVWDGSAPPRELLRTTFPIHDATVGPLDGFAVIREMGNDDLWIASLEVPDLLRKLVSTGASEIHPRLTRDGSLLAYSSDESGQFEIYVQPMTGGNGRVRVSKGGGTQPVWSTDGDELFFRGPRHLMRARVSRDKGVTVQRVDTLFTDIYERHNNVTNYDVFPGGDELLMIRPR